MFASVSVARLAGGLDRALAAGRVGQRVGVLVMAEQVVDLDPRAVRVRARDRAVLGVVHGHVERDLVAEVEEAALGRRADGDLRRRVADHDRDVVGAGLVGLVGDGQRRVVGPDAGVGVAGIRVGARRRAVAEVPQVRDAAAVGVARALAGELHRERVRARRGLVGARDRDRPPAALHVVDAVERGAGVAAEEAAAVVEDVERAVGPELHVHRVLPLERRVVEERADLERAAGGVERGLLDPVAPPLVREPVVVEVRGELGLGRVRGVVVVDRAAHRRLRAAGLHLGLPRAAVAVPDVRQRARRQRLPAGVVGRRVGRRGAVELRPRLAGREVVVVEGVVVAGAVRPAVVAGRAQHAVLDLAAGAAGRARPARVGPVVADVDVAGLLVDGDAERVAEAHRVDLGPRVRLAGGEQVAGRDRVGGGRRVGLDPQHLAAQVVGVGRAALGVEGRVAGGALVDRRVAVGLERVRVVAGREVEVAGRVPREVAAVVAADAAVLVDLEQLLLGGQVHGLARRVPLEAAQVVLAVERRERGRGAVERGVAARGVERRRVVDVDPVVGGEARVDRDRLQAVLVVAVDGQVGGDLGVAVRVRVADRAVARGVEDTAVGEHGEADRLAGLGGGLGERDALEAAPDRAAALALDELGGPLDPAEQVLAELGLGVGLVGVAAARVPRAAAVVGVAPRGRVVGAVDAARVRRLVERRQHVDLPARVALERVPLVEPLPALRQVARRRVLAVGDLDRRVLVGRVALEVGADQPAVPLPAVLGVGRGVDAGVAAAGLDVLLERRLLGRVERVAGGGEEDHGVVLAERGGGEVGGVLRPVDGDPVAARDLADRGPSDRDRVVPEAGRLAEDEDLLLRPERGLVARRADGREARLCERGWREAQAQRNDRRHQQAPTTHLLPLRYGATSYMSAIATKSRCFCSTADETRVVRRARRRRAGRPRRRASCARSRAAAGGGGRSGRRAGRRPAAPRR